MWYDEEEEFDDYIPLDDVPEGEIEYETDGEYLFPLCPECDGYLELEKMDDEKYWYCSECQVAYRFRFSD